MEVRVLSPEQFLGAGLVQSFLLLLGALGESGVLLNLTRFLLDCELLRGRGTSPRAAWHLANVNSLNPPHSPAREVLR